MEIWLYLHQNRIRQKLEDKNADFYRNVYEVVAAIPGGTVTTYGDIALLLGKPQNSRLVGRALSLVPADLDLPCHRVVNASGRLTPGWAGQRELLLAEGVTFKKNGEANLKECRWNWKLLSV